MRIVKEKQKYWSYEDWQKIYNSFYQPLIDNHLISNVQTNVDFNTDNDTVDVTIEYFDARELGDDRVPMSLPRPEPTQLPPHIKADYIITLTTPTINDALDIINNYQKYWPGVDMNNLSISQNKDEEAVSILVFANYEADIEIEPEEGVMGIYE